MSSEVMIQMGYKAGREKQIPALYENDAYMTGYVWGRKDRDAADARDSDEAIQAAEECHREPDPSR